MAQHDERALLQRTARRDQRAFATLYDLYSRSISVERAPDGAPRPSAAPILVGTL